MPAMTKVPDDHPLMVAWNAYRASDEGVNSDKWARTAPDEGLPYLEGALWAAFMAGFKTATERSVKESAAFPDREALVQKLAQRLHYKMAALDPNPNTPEWEQMDSFGRDYYESCVEDLLNELVYHSSS